RLFMIPICCRPLRTRERMVSWSSTTTTWSLLAAGMSGLLQLVLAAKPQYFGTDFLERKLASHRARLEGGAGHAVNDGACLVLANGIGAGSLHRGQSVSTVAAHSRQNDTHSLRGGMRGHRMKQSIDR